MPAVIAELEIPPDQVAFSDTLSQFEEISFDIQEIIAHGDMVSPFVWVSGVNINQLEAAFNTDPSVGSYRQLTEQSDGSVLYEIEWSQNIDVMRHLIDEAGAVLHATGETDRWFFRLLFPTHEALSQAYKQCQQNGLNVDIIRVSQAEDSAGGTTPLTEAQQAAVIEAFERGFYDIPRQTTLNELSESRGTSHQALSEQLRRANRNLVGTYVMGRGRGDQCHTEE